MRMIEMAMVFGMGFLAACLLGIVIINAVWRRAVRRTTRQIEAVLPMSLSGIKADRDQLRAQFAAAARKLEMSVEQMKQRLGEQLIDISKKNEQVRLLLNQLKERAQMQEKLESERDTLQTQLIATQTSLSEAKRSLHLTQSQVEQAQLDLSARDKNLIDLQESAQTRAQIMEQMQTHTSQHEQKIEELTRQITTLESDLLHRQQALMNTQTALTEQRALTASFTAKLDAGEQTTHSLAEEVGRLQMKVQEQAALITGQLTAATQATERFEAALSERNTQEAALLQHAAESETRAAALLNETEILRHERTSLQTQLTAALAEKTTLQDGISLLEKAAHAGWEKDQLETALLRERITDLAADITAMTLVLEGEQSPLRKMLIEAEQAAAAAPSAHDPRRLSLAERIRLLAEKADATSLVK